MWSRIPIGLLAIGIMLALCCMGSIYADDSVTVTRVDPRLSVEDDASLNRQAGFLFQEIAQTLAQTPPQFPEPDTRRLALHLADTLLHDVYAINRPPVQAFFHDQMEKAVAQMEKTKVERGATIWKLYNMGFVVRTATVTLGFDLYRGAGTIRGYAETDKKATTPAPGFPASNALMERLAAQCDVLFVSHAHGDHVDEGIIQCFIDQRKPVVGPETILAGRPQGDRSLSERSLSERSLSDRITHLKREPDLRQKLAIQKGARELDVVCYPGQQYQGKGTPNNVVIVYTPEGLSFSHNGDEMNDPYPQYQEDFKWIDKVHETQKVDVVMMNCWMNDPVRFVKGFDPKLVLPGHQNEMGHPMWDRIPFWGDYAYIASNFAELKNSKYPVIPMFWGEMFHYTPDSTK